MHSAACGDVRGGEIVWDEGRLCMQRPVFDRRAVGGLWRRMDSCLGCEPLLLDLCIQILGVDTERVPEPDGQKISAADEQIDI